MMRQYRFPADWEQNLSWESGARHAGLGDDTDLGQRSARLSESMT